VLESFVGKEEELNEQMRLRYKADLNGEYPDPPESEAASDAGELTVINELAHGCKA
jgi:hypothetical protein